MSAYDDDLYKVTGRNKIVQIAYQDYLLRDPDLRKLHDEHVAKLMKARELAAEVYEETSAGFAVEDALDLVDVQLDVALHALVPRVQWPGLLEEPIDDGEA